MLKKTRSLSITLLVLSLAQCSLASKKDPPVTTNDSPSRSQINGRTVTLNEQGMSLTIPIGWHKESGSIEAEHSSFVWRGPNNTRFAVNVSDQPESGNRSMEDDTNSFFRDHKGSEDLRFLEIDGVRGVHYRWDWDSFNERYQPELDKAIKWAGQRLYSGKREVIIVDLSCSAKTFSKDKDTLYNTLQSIKFIQSDSGSAPNSLKSVEIVDEAPVVVSVLDREFYVRKRRVERTQVATEVDNLLWNLPEEKRIVYIKPMPNVAYGVIVGIIDDLRVLGYDRIGLVADRAGGKPKSDITTRSETGPKAGESSGGQATGADDLLVVTFEAETGGQITVRVGDVHVPLRELASKVRALLKDRANRNIRIVAPDTVHYGSVVEVIDAAKAGGAETIEFGSYVKSP